MIKINYILSANLNAKRCYFNNQYLLYRSYQTCGLSSENWNNVYNFFEDASFSSLFITRMTYENIKSKKFFKDLHYNGV